mgnify:CR=1 FL=1
MDFDENLNELEELEELAKPEHTYSGNDHTQIAEALRFHLEPTANESDGILERTFG